MHFGQELKEERQRQGISLDEISSATRVSTRHLQALEDDRFADLPGGVFNRGIVRSYASACGLDPEHTLRGFVTAMDASGFEGTRKDDDWVEFAEAVRRNRTGAPPSNRLRWLGVLGMVLALMLLAAAVAWLLVHRGIVGVPPQFHIPHLRHRG